MVTLITSSALLLPWPPVRGRLPYYEDGNVDLDAPTALAVRGERYFAIGHSFV
ncbi:hypothetical protein SBDP1_270021 [Syntrophobacter sp. SbD1]|nr:hypothetical protein SBDP1_270021 [Syntrophobacter sp. SbD1]